MIIGLEKTIFGLFESGRFTQVLLYPELQVLHFACHLIMLYIMLYIYKV